MDFSKLAKHAILALGSVAVSGLATAQTIVFIGSAASATNITTSTTWTKNNVYSLQGQVYVRPGATLTIEAGTVIGSIINLTGAGAVAVERGAQVHILGEANDPVIATSIGDVINWQPSSRHPSGRDPSTGFWREACNEWGNFTIMGRGYISENATPGNVPTPNANNTALMEGLVADLAFPGRTLYGGGDDYDDSGTIRYFSTRYGGRVVGLNNELNGLSLGGIGRGTDIHHVEVMNNVDDGIEIWGGTVNLKYFSIWNVGDDSFDVDQGWRGKAQFGLIVQGYSIDADQGSGVGDNGFEVDGAEDSDWQPVTTASIYNCTFIGQPDDGDGATAWRDNARVQYRNCIFMDCGEKVVRDDGDDGDGASGYGFNNTLTWEQTWTTDYNVYSTVNAPPMGQLAEFYQAQTSGKLAEISDSVFYNNADYGQAIARGVLNATPPHPNNNVAGGPNGGPEDAGEFQPIRNIVRASSVMKGGKSMLRVLSLDPRASASAQVSAGMAPNDGFFTPVQYRGAFAPTNDCTWLAGWAASWAYGLIEEPTQSSLTFIGPASPPGCPSASGMISNVEFVDSVEGGYGQIVDLKLTNYSPTFTLATGAALGFDAPNLDISAFGWPGCYLGNSWTIDFPTGVPDANGEAFLPPIEVPNDPAQLGAYVNIQPYGVDSPAAMLPTAFGFHFGRHFRLTIGCPQRGAL